MIPCHRVISKVGDTHRYRWGATWKKAILEWEAGRFWNRNDEIGELAESMAGEPNCSVNSHLE